MGRDVVHRIASAKRALSEHVSRTGYSGHAVIPGGVHTLEAAHKAYPNLGRASLQSLRQSVFAYVSFRGNDGKLYWTAKRRLIPVGTAVISDGTTWILQRCGNQIRFDLPKDATVDYDPPTDVFPFTPDEPIALVAPEVHSSPAPPLPIEGVVPPPPTTVVTTTPPPPQLCCFVPGPPPRDVPEPATAWFLATALAFLVYLPTFVFAILRGRK